MGSAMVYRKLFTQLMTQRRPMEVAQLKALPPLEQTEEGIPEDRWEEEVEEVTSRMHSKEMDGGTTALLRARKAGLSWEQQNQRREEGEAFASAENCEQIEASIEWEPEAKARAIEAGTLEPETVPDPLAGP
jgi:hypothetical protein